MDLKQALQNHSEWKMKFRSAISQKKTLDASIIEKDDCCELGKWLHGDGKSKYSHLASFSDCVTKHAAFHREAGKVAELINSENFSEAETMVNSSSGYTSASNEVGMAIILLKKEANL